MKPVLYDYFKKTAKILAAHYDRGGEQNASANLGRNRENFCKHFLDNVLPPKLKVTSGEIWDSTGFKTGQLDLIIIREDAPSLEFGTDNSYLSEGVFAVLEIKSNLDRTKLSEAAQSMKKVSNLHILSSTTVSSGAQLDRPIRIVFGYEGATWKTIVNEINTQGYNDVFDAVCILNRGILINKGGLFNVNPDEQFLLIEGDAACLGFMYYHLITYGTSFLGRVLNITPYFHPISYWMETE